MKYVIVPTELLPMAILIPELVQHADAVNLHKHKPISAGFFTVEHGRVVVDARRASLSLNLAPKPGDAQVIEITLQANGVKSFCAELGQGNDRQGNDRQGNNGGAS